MIYTVTARLKRPDNQHTTKRTLEIEAPSPEEARAVALALMASGGYAAYREVTVLSVTDLG